MHDKLTELYWNFDWFLLMIYSGLHIVAMGLYSKRGCQNVVVTDTLSCTLFATYFFVYHILTFSVTLFLNRCTATWNLVVKYTIFFIILSQVIQEKNYRIYTFCAPDGLKVLSCLLILYPSWSDGDIIANILRVWV